MSHHKPFFTVSKTYSLDCPNGFVHLNNQCFQVMTPDTWYNQYRSCKLSRGTVLKRNSENEKIIKSLMATHNLNAIFVDPENFSKSVSFIEDHSLLAKLLNDQLEYISIYGHDSGNEKYSAICQYIGDIKFTKWGITNDQFEPLEDKNCLGLCVNDDDANCDGSWKTMDCESNHNFICQVQCK